MGLSKSKERIVKFIKEYRDKHGISPSVREIAEGVNLSSTTVHYHVEGLTEMNVLENKGVARGILPRQD